VFVTLLAGPEWPPYYIPLLAAVESQPMGLCNVCQDMLAKDEREEALRQREARRARWVRLRS
jgi:hypothetical protein